MMIKYFHGRSRSIISAALVVGVAGFGSRLLGVLRERLLSTRFGAGSAVDAYAAAFRIPDALFGLFVVGAVSSAFIPVFSEYLYRKKKEQALEAMAHDDIPPSLTNQQEALNLAISVLNTLALAIGILAVIAFIFAPTLASVIAPGFSSDKQALTALLLRIMLLQPIILSVSNVIGAVLQTYRQFVAYSLAPVFYNIGIIIGIILSGPNMLGVPALAYGVVLGALLHLAIQIPALPSTGFRWRPLINLHHPGQRQIFHLMLPRTIGIAGDQAGLIVLTAIASTLAVGSNAILYYSDNIRALPTGIIGIAFSIAAFPMLSASMARKHLPEFARALANSIRHVLYLVIPATITIYLLRAHIVRVILGTSKFSWSDTILAVAMVGAFSFSIVFQALVPLLAKTFYAMQNTRTPVKIALMSAAITLASAFFLVHQFAIEAPWTNVIKEILRIPDVSRTELIGLALAFGLSATVQALTLTVLLARRLKGLVPYREIGLSLAKTLTAGAALAVVLYATRNFFAPLATDPDLHTTVGLFFQAVFSASAGAIAFILTSWVLNSKELHEFMKLVPELEGYKRNGGGR